MHRILIHMLSHVTVTLPMLPSVAGFKKSERGPLGVEGKSIKILRVVPGAITRLDVKRLFTIDEINR